MAERFEVVRVLGQGGAGIVYHARDREHGDRPVALKILVNDSGFDPDIMLRFREELRVLQTLDHPNLVKAYDFINAEGMIAFTMEFVDGSDLGTLLRERPLTLTQIDKIMDPLLSALGALHGEGIAHRDVKLENILVGRDGVLKLGDLGLMKSPFLKGLTRTGILLGTAQYMPPEYVYDSLYDERGDIYAVGIVLLELLTRERRLADLAGNQVLEHLIKTKFEIARETLATIPRRYLPIVNTALATKPKMRYQTTEEMRLAIRESITEDGAFAQGRDIPRPAPILLRRREAITGRLIATTMLCATLVALGGVARWKLLSRTPAVVVQEARAGTYRGELWSADGTTQTISITLDPGHPSRAQVKSAMKGCPSGWADLAIGKLVCEKREFEFRLEPRSDYELEGSITEPGANVPARFTVKRPQETPGKE